MVLQVRPLEAADALGVSLKNHHFGKMLIVDVGVGGDLSWSSITPFANSTLRS